MNPLGSVGSVVLLDHEVMAFRTRRKSLLHTKRNERSLYTVPLITIVQLSTCCLNSVVLNILYVSLGENEAASGSSLEYEGHLWPVRGRVLQAFSGRGSPGRLRSPR